MKVVYSNVDVKPEDVQTSSLIKSNKLATRQFLMIFKIPGLFSKVLIWQMHLSLCMSLHIVDVYNFD